MNIYFVTLAGTYLDNGQVYHAFEGIVAAKDKTAAQREAFTASRLRAVPEVWAGVNRTGDYEDNQIFETPEGERLILDDIYIDLFTTHLMTNLFVQDAGYVQVPEEMLASTNSSLVALAKETQRNRKAAK